MTQIIRHILLLSCLFFYGYAQETKLREDSLVSLIYIQKITGAEKVKTMIALARLKKEADYVDAKIIAEKAIEEAGNLKQPSLRAEAYNVMAEIEDMHSHLDSAIHYYERAIQLYDPRKDQLNLAKALNLKGIVHESKGQYVKSYQSYIYALRIYDELNDEIGICNEYLNIGLIHQYNEEYKQARTYFNQSLAMARKIGHTEGIAAALNNLGIYYKEQNKLREAYDCFKQVLDIDYKQGNESNIATSLNNLGTINSDMGKEELALELYYKSARIKKKLKDQESLSNTYNNIATSLFKLQRINEAEIYLKDAESIGKQYNLPSILEETYNGLYEVEYSRKNYKQALEYHLKFQQIKDSIQTNENNTAIHDLENQYKLDKANAEIALKNTELENGAVLRISFIIIIVLLVLISLYFLYTVQHTNKLSRALNKRNDDLMKAKENAEQATTAKTQFLSVMSHEIRTPLNAIIGIANLLNEDLKNEAHKENINVLRIASQNLLLLINDLLDLNKLEVGKMEAANAQLNVRKVVDTIKEMFAVSASQKGIELKLEFDYHIPTALMGDETKLNQAITNLVSNAIKFTEKGFVEIRVKLEESKADSSTILFAVTDTGIGIPADKQQTIFESFAQVSTDTNRKYGGTGLGLSISQKLIDVMGGTLQVKSDLLKGSEFSFSLTFLHNQTDYQKPAIEVNTDSSLFEGKSILIADDNAVNIFVLKQFLKKWGITIVEVENGLEAFKMMYKHSFDMVLMDVQMPIKDGIDATIDIRNAGKEWSAVPIIAITASHEDEVRVKIKACGMNDFIIKPFMPSDLLEKLSKYL
ncbi:MAG: tetratricopeptide repeat protein [Bacteroidota bacterium]